jgi:putative transcription factor
MGELYCDICGRTPVISQILLEGAKLLACGRCMKSGKIIHRFYEEGEQRPIIQQRPGAMDSGEEVVDGYGRIIKQARERAKIPISVVAERISEKESYLTAIENERLKPTVAVAKKLEKELGVKLLEKTESSIAPSAAAARKSFKEPTLEDMLEEK